MATRPTAFSSILLGGYSLSGVSGSLYFNGATVGAGGGGSFVDLSSDQTISGNKSFTNNIITPQVEAQYGWKFDLDNGVIYNPFSVALDLNNKYVMDPDADDTAFSWAGGGLRIQDAVTHETAADFSATERIIYDAVQVMGQPSISADFKNRFLRNTGDAGIIWSAGLEVYNNLNGGLSALIGYCDNGTTIYNQLFNSSETVTLDWQNRILSGSWQTNETIATLGITAPESSISLAGGVMLNSFGVTLDFINSILMDVPSETKVMEWANGGVQFFDQGGTVKSLDFTPGNRTVYDATGGYCALFEERLLLSPSGLVNLEWYDGVVIYDNKIGNAVAQIGASNGFTTPICRLNRSSDGVTTLDWNSLALSGNWSAGSAPTAAAHIVNLSYLSGNYQSKNLTLNTRTGNYSGQLSDVGNHIEFNSTGSTTLFMSNIAWPNGCQIKVSAYGSGITTISGVNGIQIRSRGDAYRLAGQYAIATLINRNTGEFYLEGDVIV